MENEYGNYLSHHGILGQKWGRKNGPPYPLDASDHSSSERKAGWRKSLSDNKKENESSSKRAGSSADTGSANRNVTVAEFELVDRDAVTEKDYPKKASPGTIESDMAAVNPDFGTSRGNTYNCLYCSAAYDLRRRGYDVSANEVDDITIKNNTFDKLKKWYKGEAVTGSEEDTEIEGLMLLRHPDGGRGVLTMTDPFLGGDGHAMNYEIKNGKIKLIDSQTNETRTWDEIFDRGYCYFDFMRTDNLEPDWNKIREAVDPKCFRKDDVKHSDLYLAHHGILSRRNGFSYSMGASDYSSKRKREFVSRGAAAVNDFVKKSEKPEIVSKKGGG